MKQRAAALAVPTNDMAKFFLVRSTQCLQRARRRRENPDEDEDAGIDRALKQAGTFSFDTSETGADRPLWGRSFSKDGNFLCTGFFATNLPTQLHCHFSTSSHLHLLPPHRDHSTSALCSSCLGTGKETAIRCLLVVDAPEPSVQEELVKSFCNRELTSYRQIFKGAALIFA